MNQLFKLSCFLLLLLVLQCACYAADGFVELDKDRITIDKTTSSVEKHTDNPDGVERDLLIEDTGYKFYTDIDIEDFKTNSDMQDTILGQAALTLGFNSCSDVEKIKLGYKVENVEPGSGGIIYTWTVTMYDGTDKSWSMDWEDISQIMGDFYSIYGIEPTNPVLNSKDTKVNYIFHTPNMDPITKKAEYYTVKLRVTLESKFKVTVSQLEKDKIKIGAGAAVAGGIPVLLPDGENTVECLFPVSFITSREIVVADNTPIGSECKSTNIVWGDPNDKKNPRQKGNYEFYSGTTGEHITDDVVVYVKDNNPMLDMEKVAVYCYYQIGPFEAWRLWDYGGNNAGLTWYTTLYPPYRKKSDANSIHHGYVSEKTYDGYTTKVSGSGGKETIQYSTMVGCIKSPGTQGKHFQHNVEEVKSELYFSSDYDEDQEGYPLVSWRGNQPFWMSYTYSSPCGVSSSCSHSVPTGGDNATFWDFMNNKNQCQDYNISYPTIMEDKYYDWPGKCFFWVGPLRMKLDKQAHSKDSSAGIDIDSMHFTGLGSAGRYTLDKKFIVLPNRYAIASKNMVTGTSDWPQGVDTWPHADLTVNSITYAKNNNDDVDWPSTATGADGGLLMFVRPVGPEGFKIDSYKTAMDFSTKTGKTFAAPEQGCAINAIRVQDNDRPLFYVAINHPVGEKIPDNNTLSATEICQKDMGQKWLRYKMSEYSEMRFYNTSPIFPIIAEKGDYTKNVDWYDVFPALKNKHPILPNDLHSIYADANDNYFNTIWENIVTNVEGTISNPPTHVLLDYHLPFPNSVGLHTAKGSRLLYELVDPADASKKNMWAEAASKNFHNQFYPAKTNDFDTKYSSTTSFAMYKNKYCLRVGVRHPFHIVLFDNLNNIHYTGRNDLDVSFFKFDNNNTAFKGTYHRILWMYSHLYDGEMDGFFAFEKPEMASYSTNDVYANETKSSFQDFNIQINRGTPFGFPTSQSDFDARENSPFVYARIYDTSEPPGFKGLRYKEYRPEDFTYFHKSGDENVSDFVFHHIFRHKSDADHRYLLEVYGQDSDGNARFLFMKLDVIDFKSTGSHTLSDDGESNKL